MAATTPHFNSLHSLSSSPLLPHYPQLYNHHQQHNRRPIPFKLTTTTTKSTTSLSEPSISLPQTPSNEAPTTLSHHHHLRLSLQCNNLSIAKSTHSSILKTQPHNTQLSNTLISTYIKLNNINYAHKLFTTLSSPDVVSYTTIISAYAKSNRGHPTAINLFINMLLAAASTTNQQQERQQNQQEHTCALLTRLGTPGRRQEATPAWQRQVCEGIGWLCQESIRCTPREQIWQR